MFPDKEGYYWIKTLDYDGTGGKSISDWYPASYGETWEFIGSECGLDPKDIVQIGPEIIPPCS